METEKEKYTLIGARIKKVREERGLSQRELAERVGFESAASISLIEAGERKISVVDLEKTAEVLNEDIGFFLRSEQKVRVAFRADGISKKDSEVIQHIIELAKKRARRDRK